MSLNLSNRLRRFRNPITLLSFALVLLSFELHARELEPDRGVPSIAGVPDCKANGRKLVIDNAAVLAWKATSRDQYRGRARVNGTITKLYSNRTGHVHLQATIGANPNDTVEIIYNESFGRIPRIPLNASIEVCGDYITARRPFNRYPASPDGALIHWVHRSNNTNHEHGYVIIDGTLYGH